MGDKRATVNAAEPEHPAEILKLGRMATEAARAILSGHENILDRKARLRITAAFRRVLFPPKRPGRRPRASITSAYEDFRRGVRGPTLYRKHIPGFAAMGFWRRQGESRKLMEALRSRRRREKERPTPTSSSAERNPLTGNRRV
jgi:hypothetical protein